MKNIKLVTNYIVK